jgi:hypothetical protein
MMTRMRRAGLGHASASRCRARARVLIVAEQTASRVGRLAEDAAGVLVGAKAWRRGG